MTEQSVKALEAIGGYMCAYSDAAYELGETLNVLFGIEDKPMAEAIVAALGDFARQANLARVLSQSSNKTESNTHGAFSPRRCHSNRRRFQQTSRADAMISV